MKRKQINPEAIQSAAYHSLSAQELLAEFNSSPSGLRVDEAQIRLQKFGKNALKPHRQDTAIRSFLSQFTSPLMLILIIAAVISAIVREWADAIIVMIIILASTILSFAQEYSASRAVEKLQSQMSIKAAVRRDGKVLTIPVEDVVPGDIVQLSAGSLIPADGVLIEANDFYVNQAVLTGETFPAKKNVDPVPEDAVLSDRTNMVFMGTSVRSGTAAALITRTGIGTEFGRIAERLTLRPPENEFERGVKKFGQMLTQIMTILVAGVFVINTLLAKPIMDSLLFAIALAVGLAPELLPAIISISLSRGAQDMAKSGVIVRRLNAIENLGSMDILCTDKTGTLTEGVVRLNGALDIQGTPSQDVMRWAYLNAAFQTGLNNPLDEAILSQSHPDTSGMNKLGEIPYDFNRKRLSVVVDADPSTPIKPELITKGSFEQTFSICSSIRIGNAIVSIQAEHKKSLDELFARWSAQGYRVLGIAVREVPYQPVYTVESDERDMTFAGFLLFFDPPKTDAMKTIQDLDRMGVQVKIITGDNHLVAQHIADALGLPSDKILTAGDLKAMNDEALWHLAEKTTIFAEVDPNQKERIILALRKMGHVVGFMGDGINDAPALHAADVGISVEQAVDVAKEAADFVLLRRNLEVLLAGIKEGRKTFANTIKYVFTTTSANFGNMLSMAGASLFLPFLPLLAKQILLNNFLSDFPAIGIPGDHVDPEMADLPHRWNIRNIRNFMIIFGLVSSIFDYATFGLLIFLAHATEQQFQTGWFIESLMSELVIALVVRTRRPFFKSRPGRLLWMITLAVAVISLWIPYSPFSAFLGFSPMPFWLLAALLAITGLYVIAAELAKKYYYAHHTV